MIPTAEQIKRLVESGRAMAADAIGKPLTVRIERATTTRSGRAVSGTIATCEPAGARNRGRSIVLQFKVTLLGPDGRTIHGPFVVEEIPR